MKKGPYSRIVYSMMLFFSAITVGEGSAKQSTIGNEAEHLNRPFFVIISPFRNNKAYYQRNFDSIIGQDYPYYHVIYTDDASTDKTADLLEGYIAQHGAQDKVTLIRNTTRQRAAANRYNMIHRCHPRSIIVALDGDDWFSHEHVLSRLAKVYSDPEVWMTYGRWESFPPGVMGGALVPDSVINQNSFRSYSYCASHLRTFYAKLFHMIKREDFLHDGKNFFPMATDPLFVFPLLEMCGYHARYIHEVLYIYNRERYSDIPLRPLAKFMRQIRGKKPYERLKTLW